MAVPSVLDVNDVIAWNNKEFERTLRRLASEARPDMSPFPSGSRFHFFREGSEKQVDVYELRTPSWTLRMKISFGEPDFEIEGEDALRNWLRRQRRSNLDKRF